MNITTNTVMEKVIKVTFDCKDYLFIGKRKEITTQIKFWHRCVKICNGWHFMAMIIKINVSS